MRSLGRASCGALRELRREPLTEPLAEPLAELRTEPLVKPLTQFWYVLYLTESLLIYNNSSLKLDSIINFPSYQSFTRGSARGSARGFYGLCMSSVRAVHGTLLKALHEALHEALPEALSEAPLELRTKLC
jgi:hypothetical protein